MAASAQRRHTEVEKEAVWESRNPIQFGRNQLGAPGLTWCRFFHCWWGGRATALCVNIRACKSLTTSWWPFIAAHASGV